jgi:hypothetical protein
MPASELPPTEPLVSATIPPAVEALKFNGAVSPEQARQFDDVIGSRLMGLSRQSELTSEEASFVGTVADLGARTVSVLLERTELPTGDSRFDEAAQGFAKASSTFLNQRGYSGEDRAALFDGFGVDKPATRHALAIFTGASPSAQDPAMRGSIEDCAQSAVTMFGSIVAASGGIELNEYVAGNLQAIVRQYDRMEQPVAERPAPLGV